MRRFAQIALLGCLSALGRAALAFDNGQYDNVPPDIRAWFKGVVAPNGVPCCDIADGHRHPLPAPFVHVAHSLLPDHQVLSARRNTLQLKRAVLARHREERVVERHDPARHPRVNI